MYRSLGQVEVIVSTMVTAGLQSLLNKMASVHQQRIRDIQTDLKTKAQEITRVLENFQNLSPSEQQAIIQDWWKRSQCWEQALQKQTRVWYRNGECLDAPAKKFYPYDVEHFKEVVRLYREGVAKAQAIQSGIPTDLVPKSIQATTFSSWLTFLIPIGLIVLGYLIFKKK